MMTEGQAYGPDRGAARIEQREYDSLSLIPAGTMRGEEEDGQL